MARLPLRVVLALAAAAGCGSRTGLIVDDAGDVPPAAEAGFDAAPDEGPDAAPDGMEEPPTPDLVEPELPAPDLPGPEAGPMCGDGRRDPAEECDLGVGNELIPAFRLSPGARATEATRPLVRRVAAPTFYRYESASAHTGFEAVGLSNAFLYVDATDNGLSLFFFAGHDDDGSPVVQPDSDMEVMFRGVPAEAVVALSDDNDELARQPTGDVRGRWSFGANTDGGILSRLPWDRAWRVVVEPAYRAGVTSARYLHHDGRATALQLRDSFAIEHFVTPARCRPDCRAPRCGDGYLDAGERCDDGNTRAGDGCAGDCRRIE